MAWKIEKIVKNGKFIVILFFVLALGFYWFFDFSRSVGAAVAYWTTATTTATWTVPSGVTQVRVKVWGAGGGGGGSGDSATGGAGGGGGYVESVISVSASESLSILVGGGGVGGAHTGGGTKRSAGGGGGGYSAVKRGSAFLAQAAGGGGGGAGSSNAAYPGGPGGPGGGSVGVDGSQGSSGCDASGTSAGAGGGGGTQSAGGAGGSACNDRTGDGTAGAANQGGAGGLSGSGGAGGLNGGGAGGDYNTTGGDSGAGGGGGGYYGGGGGEVGAVRGGGGGGGGSATSTGSSIILTAGSGVTAANTSDSDYSTYCTASAGQGGAGGTSKGSGTNGNQGCVVILYNAEAPAFSGNVTSDPSSGGTGTVVTFSGTATDAGSDKWYLAVCRTNAITPGSPPTCATGETICVSTSTVASGNANTCVWEVPVGLPRDQAWYAFACDNASGVELCSAANTANSPFSVIIGSTQVSLDDIYCKITQCTPTDYGIERAGAAAASMRTLQEIYDADLSAPWEESYGRGWTPNSSGDGSTALTEAACEAASGWEWFKDANGDGDTSDPEDGICVRTSASATGSWNGYYYVAGNRDSSWISDYTCAGNFPSGYVDTYSGINASGVADTTWADGKCALCQADCYDGKKDLPDRGGYVSGGYTGPITPEVLKNWKGTRLPTMNDFFGFCGYKDGGSNYETGCSSDKTHGTNGQMVGRTDECMDLSNSGAYEWLSEQEDRLSARIAGNSACSYSYNYNVYSPIRARSVFRP